MPKQNIKADLKKYKPYVDKKEKQQPVSRILQDILPPVPSTPITIPPTTIISTTQFLDGKGSWAKEEMEYRMTEMDRIIKMEEGRMAAMMADPNQLISPHQRTIYLNCGHKVSSYVSTIKLDSFYYCELCVLFKKVEEVL